MLQCSVMTRELMQWFPACPWLSEQELKDDASVFDSSPVHHLQNPENPPLHRAPTVVMDRCPVLALATAEITSIYHPRGWGCMMSDKVVQLRPQVPDTEKITINLGYVDLGRIDLLVQEGFFSNRTDFIRTAIRNQLRIQSEEVSRSIERHRLEVGLLELDADELEAARAAGELLHVKVVGLIRIAPDVTPELALQTIGSLTVLGALQASREIKAALAPRIK
jgi:Arc/MetJ-type ribon-helix-helix transcriptional regulator